LDSELDKGLTPIDPAPAGASSGDLMTATRDLVADKREQFAFHDDITYLRETKRGLTRETVEEISGFKGEPDWMLQNRLRAYDHFVKRPMPTWTDGLDRIDFDKIVYYRKPSEREEKSWDDVPDQIKQTFERLGIPEAERKFLAGVGAQYDSEVVYHSVREELQNIGVVFTGMDQALKDHEDIVRKYFATVVPAEDNKFSALNTAVWSGGSFVYVPKGVEVPLPLQAYFRINGENTGQFERTLIVVEEGAKVHYIEGCTAPIYATDSLHAAVVEVVALPGSKVRYTTIQNWSNDVYNLVTKRAHAYENSTVEWIDANTGSRKTVKFPSIYLRGPNATADIISVAVAGKGQHQDTGAKAIHLAPNTRSRIVSKSVSKDGGRATYRGHLKVSPGATNVVASVRCDALMLDDISRSDTYPYIDIQEDDTTMTHEATVGKVSADQVFYLMSRGLTENEATNLIVQGFLEVFTKELPMEYAIEFNRLVKLEMEGSLG
jgi:Fe-S cluster assembly protein SufB